MKTKVFSTLGIGVGLMLGIMSCDNSETQLATVQVSLIDAPADYDAVNVDIRDVQVNTGSGESGWQSLEQAEAGVYDLLQLTNGESQFLGEIALAPGELGQVRLILGEENTLVQDGETIALTVPSGAQSGLKLNVNEEIQAGVTYQLVIDFDAARSVVEAGNSGRYNLKPTLRASMDAKTGAISGTVAPAGVSTTLYAIDGTDTLTSTYADAAGAFLLGALPSGIYTITAAPETGSGYINTDVTGVSVTIGNNNDIGEIGLLQE